MKHNNNQLHSNDHALSIMIFANQNHISFEQTALVMPA